jgi:hypothetical protein
VPAAAREGIRFAFLTTVDEALLLALEVENPSLLARTV